MVPSHRRDIAGQNNLSGTCAMRKLKLALKSARSEQVLAVRLRGG